MIFLDKYIESELVEYKNICGIDEVGRGSLFGPVVAAAIIMNLDDVIDEVNDSKKITKKKRILLAREIEEKSLAVGIGIVDNKTIDKINIKQATRLAMKLALENMIEKFNISPGIVLIDAENIDSHINQKSIVHGDSLSYNIAAASIYAKVFRDNMIIKLAEEFPYYSLETNMGYGTKKHYEGLLKYGKTIYHRESFLKKDIR